MEKVKNLRFVAYTRKSTDKQSEDSFEAQQYAIEEYIKANKGVLIEVFQDTLSGREDNRPSLQQAIKACQDYNATLIVSKIDRLARRLPFLVTLREKYHIEFIALDIPTTYSIHMFYVLALFADLESEMIRERTREAIAAKRADGSYNPTAANLIGVQRNPTNGQNKWKQQAKEHRILMFTEIERLYKNYYKQNKCHPTYAEMSELLNQNYNQTLRGLDWNPKALQHLIEKGIENGETNPYKFKIVKQHPQQIPTPIAPIVTTHKTKTNRGSEPILPPDTEFTVGEASSHPNAAQPTLSSDNQILPTLPSDTQNIKIKTEPILLPDIEFIVVVK